MSGKLGKPDVAEVSAEESAKCGPPASTQAVPKSAFKRWLKPILLGTAIVVSLGATLTLLFLVIPRRETPVSTERALAALDSKDYKRAYDLANLLEYGVLGPNDPLGLVPFIRGAAAAGLAEERFGQLRRRLLERARDELDVAKTLGLPREQEEEATILLGRTLLELGDHVRAKAVLISLSGESVSELYRPRLYLLQAICALAYRPGGFSQAITFLEQYSQCSEISEEDRHLARLTQASLLAWEGRANEAKKLIADISVDSPWFARAKLVEGQTWLAAAQAGKRGALTSAKPLSESEVTPNQESPGSPARASQERSGRAIPSGEPNGSSHDSQANRTGSSESEPIEVPELLRRAIDAFQLAQTHDNLVSRCAGEAAFWTSACLEEMNHLPAATAQWERVTYRHSQEPVGIAAAWKAGDGYRRSGELKTALILYRRAVQLDRDRSWSQLDLRNVVWQEWFGPGLHKKGVQVYRELLDGGRAEQAILFLEALQDYFAPEQKLRFLAEAFRTAAEELQSQAEKVPASERDAVFRKARLRFRQAGITHLQLARILFTTREYPDQLWWAAECLRRGQNYKAAMDALERYIQDQPTRRRPWALLHLGESLLSLGRIDEALSRLEACIQEYPRDAASFPARVWAARAYVEKGDFSAAERLLLENLEGEYLTPASREWRDSLMELGLLRVNRTRFPEAAQCFEELIARYPGTNEALTAGYLLGYTFLEWGADLEERAHRSQYPEVKLALLSEAKARYQQAVDRLRRLQQSFPMGAARDADPLRERVRRNLSFALGRALFCSGQPTEALAFYDEAIMQIKTQPESIHAYLQQIKIRSWLGQTQEASRLLDEARSVLNRLDDAAFKRGASLLSKSEWEALLHEGTLGASP